MAAAHYTRPDNFDQAAAGIFKQLPDLRVEVHSSRYARSLAVDEKNLERNIGA